MDSAFGHWLSGFFDGEGCFYIRAYRNQHRERAASDPAAHCCAASISLRRDDEAVLAEIAALTGIGNVLRVGSYSTRRKPQSRWNVTSREDCRALVAIFDEYPLRAKKARDFAIWREAVLLWTDTHRRAGLQMERYELNRACWSHMAELHSALRLQRTYAT